MERNDHEWRGDGVADVTIIALLRLGAGGTVETMLTRDRAMESINSGKHSASRHWSITSIAAGVIVYAVASSLGKTTNGRVREPSSWFAGCEPVGTTICVSEQPPLFMGRVNGGRKARRAIRFKPVCGF